MSAVLDVSGVSGFSPENNQIVLKFLIEGVKNGSWNSVKGKIPEMSGWFLDLEAVFSMMKIICRTKTGLGIFYEGDVSLTETTIFLESL